MFELRTEAVETGGHLRVRVTVASDGQVVDGELVAPFNGRQRRAVAQRLAARVASGDAQDATADEIERRVLEAAEAHRKPAAQEPKGEGAAEQDVEADALAIVRPEVFVRKDVVGVSVPETVLASGAYAGRWRVYLTTPADGRRWRAELSDTLAVGEGGAELCVRPVPGEPALPTNPGWGHTSRRAWLTGAATPTVRQAFAQIYKALDDFLDVGQGEGESRSSNPETNPKPETRNGEGDAVRGSELFLGSDFEFRMSPPHPILATLALWTLLTYCFPAWDAVPYLYVGGPAGSGKTRVFELLSRLVFRPLASSNVSAPALFRTLHERGGTLLLDEAERLKEGAPEVAEVRSILLAGYKRGGKASRLESGGDGSYRMQEFDVFGPKAIACINGVDGPLATRCIGIQMIRSAPDATRPRRRVDRNPFRWQQLRDTLHTCLLGELGQHAPPLSETPEVCPLGGRPGELWQPLLALATLADPDETWGLHKILTAHATEQAELGKDEHFPEEDLIVLTALTKKRLEDQFPSATDLLRVCKMRSDKFGKWSAQKMGACLKLYGITSTRKKDRREYQVGIDQLKRLELSYGVDFNTEGRKPELLIRPY